MCARELHALYHNSLCKIYFEQVYWELIQLVFELTISFEKPPLSQVAQSHAWLAFG